MLDPTRSLENRRDRGTELPKLTPTHRALTAAVISFGLAGLSNVPWLTVAPTETASVSGKVTAADGTIPKVGVTVLTASGFNRGTDFVDPETGEFEISGIEPGEYRIEYYIHNRPPESRLLSEFWGDAYTKTDAPLATLVAGANSGFDAHLDNGTVISGRLDSVEGPLERAYISIAHRENWLPQINPVLAWFDAASGTYRSTPLWPGQYSFFVQGPSDRYSSEYFDGQHLALADSAARWIDVPAATELVADFTLERTGAIGGDVVVNTASGPEPFGDSRAYLHGADEEYPTIASASIDDEGRFEFVGVEPGSYRVSVEGGGQQRALRGFHPGNGTFVDAGIVEVDYGQIVSGVDVALQQGGNFRAVVSVDGVESPVGGSPWSSVDIYRLDSASAGYEHVWTGFPGPDGVYESQNFAPGVYAAYFRHDDTSLGGEWHQDARYFVDRTDFDIVPGQTTDLGNVVLEARYFDVARIKGPDRFAVSVATSKEIIPPGESAPVVYIANGLNYPDALGAGPAAIAGGGPLLLVTPSVIPDVVAGELDRLDPDRIVVIGGPASVSAGVVSELRKFVRSASDVTRVAGSDRYAVSRELASSVFASGAPAAFIATGRNYPDALAAGPAAGLLGAPVILVDGTSPQLDEQTSEILEELGVEQIFIVGGPASVSSGIESDLSALVGVQEVTRLSGGDRFQVADAISATFFSDTEVSYMASGFGFADALAGAPLAGADGAPIILSTPSCIPVSTAATILEQRVAGIVLLGGEASLTPSVEDLTLCG